MDDFAAITAVVNHGTIVAVHLEGRVAPVYFDHSPFLWLLLTRTSGNYADDLLGQRARVVAGTETELLEFEEEENHE